MGRSIVLCVDFCVVLTKRKQVYTGKQFEYSKPNSPNKNPPSLFYSQKQPYIIISS